MDPMGMNHNSPRGSPRPFEFFGIPFESQAGREQIAEMVKEGGSVLTDGGEIACVRLDRLIGGKHPIIIHYS